MILIVYVHNEYDYHWLYILYKYFTNLKRIESDSFDT